MKFEEEQTLNKLIKDLKTESQLLNILSHRREDYNTFIWYLFVLPFLHNSEIKAESRALNYAANKLELLVEKFKQNE